MILAGSGFLILGALGGCATVVIPFAVSMDARRGNSELGTQQLAPIMAVYVILAVVGFWIGFGAIFRKRWARTLIVIMAVQSLVVGIVSTLIVPMAMFVGAESVSRTNPSGAPTPPPVAFVVIAVVVIALFMIALPLLLWLGLRGPDVKMTVEHYDPKVRWTDSRPIEILGLALTYWLFAVFMLPTLVHPQIAMFGHFFTGAMGALLTLVIAGVHFVAGTLIFACRKIGFTLAISLIAFLTLGTVCSPLILGVTRYAQETASHSGELQTLPEHPVIVTLMAIGSPLLMAIAIIGFLCYTRRKYSAQLT